MNNAESVSAIKASGKTVMISGKKGAYFDAAARQDGPSIGDAITVEYTLDGTVIKEKMKVTGYSNGVVSYKAIA